MPIIQASRLNPYAGSPLDRASQRRDDETWVGAAVGASDSLWAPVWRSRNLMQGVADGRPEAVFLTGEAASALRMAGGPWVFLGLHFEKPLFAVDASAADDPLPLLPQAHGAFTDLRAVAGLLPPNDAAILAHARGMMHWRSRHRFCGVCGAPCAPVSAGNVLRCTACETSHFPRTDPAVIMLVRFRRPRAARPRAALPDPGHVFDARGVRGAGRVAGGGRGARGVRGNRRARGGGPLSFEPALAVPAPR